MPEPRRLAKMRTRILIKELRDGGKDKMGGKSNALVTVAERWASVEPVGGRANNLAGVLQSNVSHRVTVRYETFYRAAQTVEIIGGAQPGAQLRVISVENQDQAGVYMVLNCEATGDYAGGA